MPVLDADKLGRRQARAIQALPSEQRFAISVVAAFTAALVLLGVLFALSGDPGAGRGRRVGFMAQDTPVQPVQPAPADSST